MVNVVLPGISRCRTASFGKQKRSETVLQAQNFMIIAAQEPTAAYRTAPAEDEPRKVNAAKHGNYRTAHNQQRGREQCERPQM